MKAFRSLFTLLISVTFYLAVSNSLTAHAEGGIAINEENFPDERFRDVLAWEYDDDGDGYLSEEEIAYTTMIDCRSKGIASLQGIEFFTELDSLNCSNNKLGTLDISKNTKLTHLECANVQLTELDLSANTQLSMVYCSYNQLTELDASALSELWVLECEGNQLTQLSLPEESDYLIVNCSNNQLQELDISRYQGLKHLNCSGNLLTELDISHNQELEFLECYDNKMETFDVTQNVIFILTYTSPSDTFSFDGHTQYTYSLQDRDGLTVKNGRLDIDDSTQVVYRSENEKPEGGNKHDDSSRDDNSHVTTSVSKEDVPGISSTVYEAVDKVSNKLPVIIAIIVGLLAVISVIAAIDWLLGKRKKRLEAKTDDDKIGLI